MLAEGLMNVAPPRSRTFVWFVEVLNVRSQVVRPLATPVANGRTTWDLTFSTSTNHTKVLDLGGATFISPSANIRHTVGYPVGAWWGKKVVDATIDPTTGKATAVFCDPGPAGGAPVLCANAQPVFLGCLLYTSP